MILDTLSNAAKYTALHPHFKTAFEFIAKPEFRSMPVGTHEIAGKDLFVIIAEDAAQTSKPEPKPRPKLEAHRKYIDIQLTLAGGFDIGWRALHQCETLHKEYDSEADYLLYADAPDFTMTLAPDTFAIFFPEDAHAPHAPEKFVKKAVVKVAV